ncbi:WD40 repeat-like protein [Cylindrobasidium torrendii FP15055 ss-10]|uniref:WD40 repeat-like protein n=1 Tax=Cylindrobasidium torrendii FP15055 ss-10 TaxID=1314674 RepID=A0A0D7BX26_9AGAR|nr:WD40 repeat-like protein [Cylindrobasidium torrendii FP15055 ss-10]
MHHSPIQTFSTDFSNSNPDLISVSTCNHGLLALPAENLTHITAYLDPLSLHALSLVCLAFNAHVKEEHTWRTAFFVNFLGIAPESDKREGRSLLLRRFESTWKQEYIARWNLEWRWKRSRTQPVVHSPVHSHISGIHAVAPNGLITSSLKYGIVARSFPLNGKIMSGFFSSASSGDGLGVGNPNNEFSPDVTACDLTTDGGTAKLVWGFTSGRVSAMSAARVMDGTTRSAGRLVQCALSAQHHGPVVDVAWDDRASAILSASMDGTVKLWDPTTMACIQTWGDPSANRTCVKLVRALAVGCFAVAMANGDIVVWNDIQRDGLAVTTGVSRIIVCPIDPKPGQPTSLPVISTMHLDTSNNKIALLFAYHDHPYFYRVDILPPALNTIRYGDESCGTITCLCASFSKLPEAGFVIVGDSLGWASVYPWKSTASAPLLKFEVHADGAAVTSLSCNPAVLVAGSSKGTIKVFDASSFVHLRTFATLEPGRRMTPSPVEHILLSEGKDAVIASAGERVMAWEAGTVKYPGRGGVRNRYMGGGKHPKAHSNTKGYNAYELKDSVKDSMAILKHEKDERDRAIERERKQNENLEQLGLSEAEVLEYVMMLSREDAPVDEGVFDVDFDADADTEDGSGSRSLPSVHHRSPLASPAPTTASTELHRETGSLSSSLASEHDFPAFANVSGTGSTSSGSGPRSWSAIAASPPFGARTSPPSVVSRSPSSIEAARRQQEEDDLALAIQLSMLDV